jgi:hypothetical protein
MGLRDRPALPRDEAIEILARELQWKTEHLDPSGDEWENLSDRQQEFYRQLVRWLLLHRDVLLAALD